MTVLLHGVMCIFQVKDRRKSVPYADEVHSEEGSHEKKNDVDCQDVFFDEFRFVLGKALDQGSEVIGKESIGVGRSEE